MISFVTIVTILVSALLLIITLVFCVEVLAGVFVPTRDSPPADHPDALAGIAVIVPAHDESVGLLPTLADITEQLRPGDRLVVVADNCSDDTAAVATRAGAEVVIRNEPSRRGKGYALATGLDYLRSRPPGLVLVIDADCRVAQGAVNRLANVCLATGKPVQALDLMVAPKGAPPNVRIAEFAWRVKNWARPLGLSALGLPCQLMGTGMAFPWEAIAGMELAGDIIVEDLKLGLDLANARAGAVFCPSACVTSEFPVSAAAARTQRLRWEQGQIGLAMTSVPRLIFRALGERNLQLLALALDLAVPPLALLSMLVFGIFILSATAALLGLSQLPFQLNAINLLLLVLSVYILWLRFGRSVLPVWELPEIILYIIRKLPMYQDLLSRKSRMGWVRTDRNKKPY